MPKKSKPTTTFSLGQSLEAAFKKLEENKNKKSSKRNPHRSLNYQNQDTNSNKSKKDNRNDNKNNPAKKISSNKVDNNNKGKNNENKNCADNNNIGNNDNILKRKNSKKRVSSLKRRIISNRNEELKLSNILEENKQEIDLHKQVQLSMHSSRFRGYCANNVTPELCAYTKEFLCKLNSFQHRAYANNPHKAATKRRFVVGLREVIANLPHKIHMVILATDCEVNKFKMPDELTNRINMIKTVCYVHDIDVIFCLKRHELANVLHRNNIVCCVGILNHESLDELYSKLLQEAKRAKQLYEDERGNHLHRLRKMKEEELQSSVDSSPPTSIPQCALLKQ